MRGCVALAACLLALPSVGGQPLPETLEGSDPAGDVQGFGLDGAPLGTVAGHDYIDVTGARIAKHSNTELLFALSVRDPEGLWVIGENNLDISASLHFVFGSVHYFLEYAGRGEACLRRYVSEGRFDPMVCNPAAVQDGELIAIVPSNPIKDIGGVRLRHPAQLSEVWAEGRLKTLILPEYDSVATFVDRAPDKDVWGALRTPNEPGAGPLLLTPVQRSQGSNGGAGVMLFEVVADNIGIAGIDAVLQVGGLPDSWSSLVPGRLHLDAGETRVIPLLVTRPFAHDHGSTVAFNLTAEVIGVQLVTQPLQVHFFDVPQPAGHHPSLFLHSKEFPGNGIGAWLDTIDPHPEDQDLPFDHWSQYDDFGAGKAHDFFWVPQSLGIGLDFDLARVGRLSVSLQSDFAVTTLASIRLDHCNPADISGRDFAEYRGDMGCPGTWLPVMQAEPFKLDLAVGLNPIDLEMAPTPYGDLLPYQSGAMLALVIELEVALTDGFVNKIYVLPADARIDLPLFEFQPPLTAALADLGNLEIVGEAVERSAGPGSQLVMPRIVANRGETGLDVKLEAIGYNAGWVHLDPETFHLEPGAELPFEVIVNIPHDATDIDFAQVYVVASSQGDDHLVTILPMRIDAQGPEIHEGSTPPNARHESPSPAPALLALAFLTLALARRRIAR